MKVPTFALAIIGSASLKRPPNFFCNRKSGEGRKGILGSLKSRKALTGLPGF